MNDPLISKMVLCVCVAGRSGSGKSTLAEGLTKSDGFQRIEVSDLIRSALRETRSKEYKRSLITGALLTAEQVWPIIEHEISKNTSTKILIVGFPRAIGSSKKLAEFSRQSGINVVGIYLQLPHELCRSRLLERDKRSIVSKRSINNRLALFNKETKKEITKFLFYFPTLTIKNSLARDQVLKLAQTFIRAR